MQQERGNSLGKRAAEHQDGEFDACFANRVSVAQAADGDAVHARRNETFREGADPVAVSIPFERCNNMAVWAEMVAN
jgi:hypothetical protein